MIEIRKIFEVKVIGDFLLECTMENGEVYHYDMSFVNQENGEMVIPLRKKDLFNRVFLDYGALMWPHGYAIHGDTIAIDGKLVASSSSVA